MCKKKVESAESRRNLHTHVNCCQAFKQIGTICFAILISFFSIPSFAENITTSPADCTQPTLSVDTGTANLTAEWEANTIGISWYSDGQKITGDANAATQCTYDQTFSLPTQPTKTGYTFTGWKVVTVPSGYTQLEYLESTGGQYIDTGVLLLSDDVVYEWNAQDKSASNGTSLFGAEYGSTRTYSGILYGNKSSRLAFLGSKKSASCGYVSADNSFHTWSFIINSDHTMHLVKDGVALSTVSWSGTLNKSNTIALYCNHTGENFNQFASVAYKYFKIYDNGELVFYGVPARRNSDNVLGMFDTVSGTFFTNAGSGTFTAGPDVQ